MSRPSALARHYWDSCLFLDLVNKTKGREDIIQNLLDDLGREDARVVGITSVLTIAEVATAHSEKSKHKLDPAVLAKIDGFWLHDSPIELVEVYPALAKEARDIIRDAVSKGKSIKPYDALHLATARKRGAVEFLTYDEGLLKLDGWFGFKVRKPTTDKFAFPTAEAAGGA